MMPSSSMCGLFCMISRSLKVPGSDSSALQTRYLGMSPLGRKPAFWPIRKPAPPRPRMPELEISSITASGGISSALRSEL